MNVENIARALGQARPSGSWWRCRCPVHQSSGPTLALREGPRGLIVYCHAACRRDVVVAELRRLGLLGDGNLEPEHPFDPAELERQRAAQEHNDRRRSAAALDIWNNETVDPRGSVAERYWASRGLSQLPFPSTIRASRSWLRHPENGSRPAMVALVEHVEHGPVAIHRTYLAIDGGGKAAFRDPRLSLGPVGGAAVRLADVSETLVVAEGIETAASVMVATGLSAWSGLSANGIEQLVLPPLPLAATVIIAADHDDNGTGERAARTAGERWLREGRRVRIALPPRPGTDWNDVLQNKDLGEARSAAA